MDPLSLTAPLATSATPMLTEEAMAHAFRQTLAELLGSQLTDLADYGCPHLGSPAVIERFSKQDGLAVLRRDSAGDDLMRVIYGEWVALGSERGLGLLQFVLQALWPDKWTIQRMHQPIARVDFYPWDATPETTHPVYGDTLLTMRIRILIDADYVSDPVALRELCELAPVLRRLVPANVTPSVFIDPPLQDVVFEDFDAGYLACVMTGWAVADFY